MNESSTSNALTSMASVVITAFVIAALYIGREILIPIALAALLAFLLSPIVHRLERWIGRIAATILAVLILFTIVGGVGWVLGRQGADLANNMPEYQQNLTTKLKSLKMPGKNRFSAFNETIDELKKDLPGSEQPPGLDSTKTTTVAVPQKGAISSVPRAPLSSASPVPVEVVETTRTGPMEQLTMALGFLAGPLGTGALVLILLFCMLLQREDLRGRMIRIIGATNISAATRGLDDAAKRVSRYLLMQLIVNASYGVVVGVGLYFIGVPSAFVWGALATVLRFIPYVGAWIASGFPIILSLGASAGWTMPLMTIGLFLVVELVSNNVMEPLLYGSSTGVSSIALIVAAVFWTWIWGAPGLVLATPLTVCLVVMGRHIPRLAILSVILSDDEALSPHEEFYHRLLTSRTAEAVTYAVQWLKSHSRTALFDSVFIPALATAENDRLNNQLEKELHATVLQELRDVIEDLGTRPIVPSKLELDKAVAIAEASETVAFLVPTCHVMTLPVRADRDEISGIMLTQLLLEHEFPATCLAARMTTGEMLDHVGKDGIEAVCVSVALPSTVVHARYLCGKLRTQFPRLRIVVGLWGATEQLTDATSRLRESGANEVVTTLADAEVQISKFAAELAQEVILTPLPYDEVERLAELNSLNLLDTEVDPDFDRITKKVAHVLNAPISIITFVDKDRQFFKSQCGLPQALADARQTGRDVSVCSHVVATEEVLVVEDLFRDRRFANNPLLKQYNLRAYAGTPLRGKGGHVLGSLCVLDHKPRQFGEADKRFLQVMAAEVMDLVNERCLERVSTTEAEALVLDA